MYQHTEVKRGTGGCCFLKGMDRTDNNLGNACLLWDYTALEE